MVLGGFGVGGRGGRAEKGRFRGVLAEKGSIFGPFWSILVIFDTKMSICNTKSARGGHWTLSELPIPEGKTLNVQVFLEKKDIKKTKNDFFAH